MGERSAGSRKVVGSSPTSSTPENDGATVIGAHEFRERFGYWIERAARGEAVAVTRHGKPFVTVIGAAPQFQLATVEQG